MLAMPLITSMWKLVSSSFSKVTGETLVPAAKPAPSSFETREEMSPSSSTCVSAAALAVALGSVSILIPDRGWNSGTATAPASLAVAARSLCQGGSGTPYTSALSVAIACTRRTWVSSSARNATGLGKRFGGDQNGAPVEVGASSGNVKVSWTMRSLK